MDGVGIWFTFLESSYGYFSCGNGMFILKLNLDIVIGSSLKHFPLFPVVAN